MSSKNRLTRSSSDRMLAGVLGGLADYFGIDPTIVRLVYILLTLMTGTAFGVILYAILWIIMPEGF